MSSKQPSHDLPEVCLVDTNFLVSLIQPQDANHTRAHEYLELLQSVGTTFILSSIVEFEYRQGDIDQILRFLGTDKTVRITFDRKDAKKAQEFKMEHEKLRKVHKQQHTIDMMLVGQAVLRSATIITGDKKLISALEDMGLPVIDINIKTSVFLVRNTQLFGSDLKA